MNRGSKKNDGLCVEHTHTDWMKFFTVGGLIELSVIYVESPRISHNELSQVVTELLVSEGQLPNACVNCRRFIGLYFRNASMGVGDGFRDVVRNGAVTRRRH